MQLGQDRVEVGSNGAGKLWWGLYATQRHAAVDISIHVQTSTTCTCARSAEECAMVGACAVVFSSDSYVGRHVQRTSIQSVKQLSVGAYSHRRHTYLAWRSQPFPKVLHRLSPYHHIPPTQRSNHVRDDAEQHAQRHTHTHTHTQTHINMQSTQRGTNHTARPTCCITVAWYGDWYTQV